MQTLHISSPWSPNPQQPHHTAPTSLQLVGLAYSSSCILGRKSVPSQTGNTNFNQTFSRSCVLWPGWWSCLCLSTIHLQCSPRLPIWAQYFSPQPIDTQFIFSCLVVQGESFGTGTIFLLVCPGQRGPGLHIGSWQLVHIKNNCKYNISYNCSDMDFCHISTKLFSETWNSIEES